ncbi:MAG: type II secretion system protein, partial [Planctomycetota bacterium]
MNRIKVTHNHKIKIEGFTLLEVTLTLVIIGYIIACIYPCLLFTMDAKERVEKISGVSKVGQAILRQISHDLEGCYTLNVSNALEGVDDGTTDSINFLSTVESAPNEEGIRSNITEVGYRVKPNEDIHDCYVLLRRESFFTEGDPLKGGTLSEVYDRVKFFNLKYNNGEEWLDNWSFSE